MEAELFAGVAVSDFDRFVESAAARGIHPGTRHTYGNGVRKVVYRDPDGNEFGFGGLSVDDDAAP